jgi:hypothetical protein
MAYLVRIDSNVQGRSLIKYLKTLNYAKVFDARVLSKINQTQLLDLFTSDGTQIDIVQFNKILVESELSDDISIDEAISKSAEWKSK